MSPFFLEKKNIQIITKKRKKHFTEKHLHNYCDKIMPQYVKKDFLLLAFLLEKFPRCHKESAVTCLGLFHLWY